MKSAMPCNRRQQSAIIGKGMQRQIAASGPQMQETEPWLSLEQIAQHVGVSTDTIHRWIRKRDMPAFKVGRLWKFKASKVDEWVQAGTSKPNSEEDEG